MPGSKQPPGVVVTLSVPSRVRSPATSVRSLSGPPTTLACAEAVVEARAGREREAAGDAERARRGPTLPGASVAPSAIVTSPPMVPMPPSVAPASAVVGAGGGGLVAVDDERARARPWCRRHRRWRRERTSVPAPALASAPGPRHHAAVGEDAGGRVEGAASGFERGRPRRGEGSRRRERAAVEAERPRRSSEAGVCRDGDRAAVDLGAAGVAVGAGERGGAVAHLPHHARPADHPREGEIVRAVEDEGAVVRDVARERARGAAVAELQGARGDRGAAGVAAGRRS